MSKGLEALEQLKYYNTFVNDDFDMTHEIEIIETELKRLEEIDKNRQVIISQKELTKEDIIERIKNAPIICMPYSKQDEILRIIKEKGVDVGVLQHCLTLADYNNSIEYELAYKPLTKEEFDLLKEWLKDDY